MNLSLRGTISTKRATFSGGVCGTMPWPRLKMYGPPLSASSVAFTRASILSPPATSSKRIEIALHHRTVFCKRAMSARGIAVSQPIASTPVSAT